LLLLFQVFLFLDGIEPFLGHQFSMTKTTKRCSSIFDLVPLTLKIYSPKFEKKSPISRLVWHIGRKCLRLPGVFRGWPIQWNHAKCCGPTLVAMATTFGLGAEIQSPTGLSLCLSVNTITPEPLKISSRNFQGSILWPRADKFENGYIEVRGWRLNVSGVLVDKLKLLLLS